MIVLIQFLFTAGIIEDRLMSKKELVEFSQLPNLEMARSQLCNVLQSAASSLVVQLQQGQQILVSHLEKHVELQNSANKDGEAQVAVETKNVES